MMNLFNENDFAPKIGAKPVEYKIISAKDASTGQKVASTAELNSCLTWPFIFLI
jgi:hypothetical protein